MMLSPPQSPSPRRPALSIAVPKTDSDLGPAKQKRLFPIACRVVPFDQWFTTRIDRTWHVQDLKIWLLSKALPPNVLPLPPSYRPSSPVTFATATGSSSSRPSPISEDGYMHVEPDEIERTVAIPYSFSTGAPSVSGMDVLRERERETESELVKRAGVYGKRWAVYSFSTGMLLTDNLPLSEFHLRPNELLELHPAGNYIPLPRTLLPVPRPLEPRKCATAVWRGEDDISNIKHGDGTAHRRNHHHHGSPYAQAYFECTAWVLQLGHVRWKRDKHGKMKEREREKDRENKGKERENEGWKRACLVIREGRVTVRREPGGEDEDHWEMTGIAGLYGPPKVKTLTIPSQPPTILQPQPDRTADRQMPFTGGTHIHHLGWHDKDWAKGTHEKGRETKDSDKWTICVSFRGGGWFVVRLDDEDTHHHLLRIFHRVSYSAITAASHTAATTRTLRTDFLPSHIPHPYNLQFSAPSPIDGDDEMEVLNPLHYGSEIENMVGLGRSLGVRFPEWREGVIRRAIKAGLGGYVAKGDDMSHRENTFKDSYDSDDDDRDSDAFSEAEWAGWAYDLDRPKVGIWDSDMYTPHESAVSGSDGEEQVTTVRRGRARSITNTSEVQAGEKSVATNGSIVARHRASTVSARSPTITTPSVTTTMTTTTTAATATGRTRTATATATSRATAPAMTRLTLDDIEMPSLRNGGTKKSLIRGLSMKAGKESLMRGLENALDFVEGK